MTKKDVPIENRRNAKAIVLVWKSSEDRLAAQEDDSDAMSRDEEITEALIAQYLNVDRVVGVASGPSLAEGKRRKLEAFLATQERLIGTFAQSPAPIYLLAQSLMSDEEHCQWLSGLNRTFPLRNSPMGFSRLWNPKWLLTPPKRPLKCP